MVQGRAQYYLDCGGSVGLSLWTCWFTVQPEETGVVQRFGKVMRTAGPGLHFKLPLGVETVRLVPTARVLKEEFGFRTVSSVPGQKTQYDPHGDYKGESLMLTGDLERYRCTVDHPIPYRRSDPLPISRCAIRQKQSVIPARPSCGGRWATGLAAMC
jgi:membrane protease subunit HflK